MPTYEYRCEQCGQTVELVHPVGADPGLCPVCKGKLHRVFTSIGVIFKGAGFHSTDYRKGPPPKEEGAPSQSATDQSSEPPKGSASEATKGSATDTPSGSATDTSSGSATTKGSAGSAS